MSENEYEIDYTLIDERKIRYDRDYINKLEITQNEDLNHFSCKAILFYILSEINHYVITNYHIIGIGNADVYDLTTRTIYVFDTSQQQNYQQLINELYPDSEVDVIGINVEEFPDNIFQRYLKLKEFVFSD